MRHKVHVNNTIMSCIHVHVHTSTCTCTMCAYTHVHVHVDLFNAKNIDDRITKVYIYKYVQTLFVWHAFKQLSLLKLHYLNMWLILWICEYVPEVKSVLLHLLAATDSCLSPTMLNPSDKSSYM